MQTIQRNPDGSFNLVIRIWQYGASILNAPGLKAFIIQVGLDGAILTYDPTNKTFTAGAIPGGTGIALVEKKATNNTVNSGYWAAVNVPGDGFTNGVVYSNRVANADGGVTYLMQDFTLTG